MFKKPRRWQLFHLLGTVKMWNIRLGELAAKCRSEQTTPRHANDTVCLFQKMYSKVQAAITELIV